MTRTTPDLAPPLQTSAPHQREDVWLLCMILRATAPIHDGSLVESGFEPGTLRPEVETLTIRQSRPFHKPSSETNFKKIIFVKKASNCFTMPTWTSVHMPYVLWLMSLHVLQIAMMTIL
ncbi:hypothetical protein AVEN_24622-1 [Araneus ventricosus]|uniref:Uncharacterized protein n=1 Tax=Araneus ventricosus TaxID=182803 RepID=A0A4Y2IJ95_ARAVE|nr:hypothetical protein AVEN_24622-1 [Araneus ventricosus]